MSQKGWRMMLVFRYQKKRPRSSAAATPNVAMRLDTGREGRLTPTRTRF